MKDIVQNIVFKPRQRFSVIFFVFFVSSLPVFLAPLVFTDQIWFAEVNWPSYTPNSRVWLIAYLVFHLLFAFQVADQHGIHHNRLAIYVWLVQVLAISLIMWALFSARSFVLVALFDLLAAATGIALLLVSKNKTIGTFIGTLPFTLYYFFAAYFALNTSWLQ